MPRSDNNIPVHITRPGITAEELVERGYMPEPAEPRGFVIRLTAHGRYRGDDETIVFSVDTELDWLNHGEWTILWDEADY
jgi:hypothetical protein